MNRLVLIIDDDPTQRAFLERILTAAGHRVVAAADGEAGLKTAESIRPDLVIVDVMMPNLNGYQTCRALRRNPATAAAPVIMLTAKDQPIDEYWAGEVGASAFLSKSSDVTPLLRTIQTLTSGAGSA